MDAPIASVDELCVGEYVYGDRARWVEEEAEDSGMLLESAIGAGEGVGEEPKKPRGGRRTAEEDATGDSMSSAEGGATSDAVAKDDEFDIW